MRLEKYLVIRGLGSRRVIIEKVKNGDISVNGIQVFDERIDVYEDDKILYLGNELKEKELKYFALYKKMGYITAMEDKRPTVVELLPDWFDKDSFFPIGRLDKDTEGLLLITDDGMLAHELLAPGKHVDKTYFVRVEGKLTVEKIEKLENGVDIGEKNLTMPAKAEIVGGSWEGAGEPEPGRVRRENLPEVYTELHLTIHEGKFHQVKRMMEAVGTPVIYLKRISMGPLILPDDLKKGECRSLTDEELRKLKT